MAGTRALRTNVTIALGFLQFAVKLHSATQKVEGPSTMCVGRDAENVHELTKVRQTLACPTCENDDQKTFVKAMEVGADSYVPLPAEFTPWTEDELKTFTNITLDVHDAAEVENATLPGEKFYYCEPQNPIAVKAYALLVNRVLARTDKAFIFEYAVRGVPAMYRLKVVNDVLCLVELARPELIRSAPVVDLAYDSASITMADAAIDALTTTFNPAAHCDQRKAALDAYVAAHTDAAVVAVAAPDAAVAPVLDLMASLKASVDAANAAKAPAKRARKVPAPRKAPAAKAAPRKRTVKSA